MIRSIVCLALASVFSLYAQDSSQKTSCLHQAQDTHLGDVSHTPLKNLFSFVVLPFISIQDPLYKSLYQPSYAILKKELDMMGSVKEVPLTYIKGIALSGVFLVVDIQQVPVLEQKSSLTKVSLMVESMTTIQKSRVDCLLPLWTRSLFLEEGSVENIEKALSKLIGQFDRCFSACNGQNCPPPTFYLYQP